jgi:hypothetical protein
MRLRICAGTVLAVVCSVVFAGCPHANGSNGSFDQRLTGTWSNQVSDINQKTFVIRPDGSFTASINPGMGGRGTVTGRLIADNGEYIMTGMAETSGTDWQNAVGKFNGTYIQMVFSGDKNFELKCKDDNLVERFFGASYHREANDKVFDYRGDDDKKPAHSLVGSWSNKKEKNEEKTFTIAPDGISFTASIDPGMGSRGTVTGKLAADGDNYQLQSMKETTGKFWGRAVGAFDNTAVQIEFSDNNNFVLKCAGNKMVEKFFGGAFSRL